MKLIQKKIMMPTSSSVGIQEITDAQGEGLMLSIVSFPLSACGSRYPSLTMAIS